MGTGLLLTTFSTTTCGRTSGWCSRLDDRMGGVSEEMGSTARSQDVITSCAHKY